jgi:probable rRNA maturation factor
LTPNRLPPPGNDANPVLIRNDYAGLQFSQGSIQELFRILHRIDRFKHPTGELSIVFLPVDIHTKLHKQFHNNPEPTDVITFRGNPVTNFGGEICVSPGFALEYVHLHGGDFSIEVTLYLIHGWLHLCGLNDIEDNDRQNMRKEERRCINLLENSDKIPDFKFST